jgi:hypothetical protein
VRAVCPRHHRQQGRAALLGCGQHFVTPQDAERIPPIHLHHDTARFSRHSGTEGVANELAASRIAHHNLQWRQEASVAEVARAHSAASLYQASPMTMGRTPHEGFEKGRSRASRRRGRWEWTPFDIACMRWRTPPRPRCNWWRP